LGGIGGGLALCAVIFFADASHSSAIPIFPFYASSLGATIMTIGALASASGLSRLVSSIPLGSFSDRTGRRRVMLLGMLCFVLAPLIYNYSSSPLHLFPARVILGFGMASTFSIGFVYVSEVAPIRRRGFFQGLYMTSMGIGFTLGPLAGGIVAKVWGYAASFYLSSGLAAAGLVLLLLAPEPAGRETEWGASEDLFQGFRRVITDSRMVSAGAANFFNSLVYSATMVYFPLYGGSIGLDESGVGMGLTVRGLVSTVSRMPTGAALFGRPGRRLRRIPHVGERLRDGGGPCGSEGDRDGRLFNLLQRQRGREPPHPGGGLRGLGLQGRLLGLGGPRTVWLCVTTSPVQAW